MKARIDGLEPQLKLLSNDQRLIFGLMGLPEPLGRLNIDNAYIPIIGTPSITHLGLRNNLLSGWRLVHETSSGNTYGKLKIQRFLTGSDSGIDTLTFNEDGTFNIPGLTDPKYILQTANANLPNAQSLGVLTTGLVKNTVTTGTGVLSTAVLNTDYYAPGSIPTAVNGGDAINKTHADAVEALPYIVKTANALLPNAQALGALSTGLLKNTTTTGLLSIAVAGTDYATLAHRLDQFALPTTSLNLNNQRMINGADPINPQDFATRAYVDANIDSSWGPDVALPFLQLNWNWANPGAQGIYKFSDKLNDAFTTKIIYKQIIADDSIPNSKRQWTEDWQIGTVSPGSNDYATFALRFNPSVTSGAAQFNVYSITLNTSTGSTFNFQMPVSMNFWRITNLGTPLASTDAANRQYVLDQVALGVSAGIVTLTGAVTGSGLVNGSFATAFSNSQTISGTTQTFSYSNALTTSILALENTNANALTRYRAGSTVDYIEVGYDGANDYSYFNIVGSSNDRYAFRFGGTGVAAVTSAGLWGMGTISPTLARLHLVGGVQNTPNEETIIRAVSALNAAKIEIQCTNGSGKHYELQAVNDGSLRLYDRTGGAMRLFVNSAGNIGVGGVTAPNGLFQFPNTVNSRQLVFYEAANNLHQHHGMFAATGGLRININSTTDSLFLYAGVNSTTSNKAVEWTGTGDCIITDTFYGKKPSGTCYMQANATATSVTGGVWTKIAGTTTSDNLNKFSTPAGTDNRLRYDGTTTVNVLVMACVTGSHNVGGGTLLGFAIFKNGSQVVPSAAFSQSAVSVVTNVFVVARVSLATNDYLEVFGNTSVNSNITVTNLTFSVA